MKLIAGQRKDGRHDAHFVEDRLGEFVPRAAAASHQVHDTSDFLPHKSNDSFRQVGRARRIDPLIRDHLELAVGADSLENPLRETRADAPVDGGCADDQRLRICSQHRALARELGEPVRAKGPGVVGLHVRSSLPAVEHEICREVHESGAMTAAGGGDVRGTVAIELQRNRRLIFGTIDRVVRRAVEDDLRSDRRHQRVDRRSIRDRQPLVRDRAFISQQAHKLSAELSAGAEDERFQSAA